MLNKFLSRFGGITNLCYYCTDKAFVLFKKHPVLEYWMIAKKIHFSRGLGPSCSFFEHVIVKFIVKNSRGLI